MQPSPYSLLDLQAMLKTPYLGSSPANFLHGLLYANTVQLCPTTICP